MRTELGTDEFNGQFEGKHTMEDLPVIEVEFDEKTKSYIAFSNDYPCASAGWPTKEEAVDHLMPLIDKAKERKTIQDNGKI